MIERNTYYSGTEPFNRPSLIKHWSTVSSFGVDKQTKTKIKTFAAYFFYVFQICVLHFLTPAFTFLFNFNYLCYIWTILPAVLMGKIKDL